MTFDDKLDKILLTHGAEQGELHYSLKKAIKDLVLSDVVGENHPFDGESSAGGLKIRQRLIINGKEGSNE